jgi:hypothetical protein
VPPEPTWLNTSCSLFMAGMMLSPREPVAKKAMEGRWAACTSIAAAGRWRPAGDAGGWAKTAAPAGGAPGWLWQEMLSSRKQHNSAAGCHERDRGGQPQARVPSKGLPAPSGREVLA